MTPTDQQRLDQLARVFAEAALEQLLAERPDENGDSGEAEPDVDA